jgi:UDP-N-acetylmuramyl pentapeptide phosphotransferase/UDP-N-acetylglucosamine-1-phosphate transferase
MQLNPPSDRRIFTAWLAGLVIATCWQFKRAGMPEGASYHGILGGLGVVSSVVVARLLWTRLSSGRRLISVAIVVGLSVGIGWIVG